MLPQDLSLSTPKLVVSGVETVIKVVKNTLRGYSVRDTMRRSEWGEWAK